MILVQHTPLISISTLCQRVGHKIWLITLIARVSRTDWEFPEIKDLAMRELEEFQSKAFSELGEFNIAKVLGKRISRIVRSFNKH